MQDVSFGGWDDTKSILNAIEIEDNLVDVGHWRVFLWTSFNAKINIRKCEMYQCSQEFPSNRTASCA